MCTNQNKNKKTPVLVIFIVGERGDHFTLRVASHSDIYGLSSNLLAPILNPEFLLFHIIILDIYCQRIHSLKITTTSAGWYEYFL